MSSPIQRSVYEEGCVLEVMREEGGDVGVGEGGGRKLFNGLGIEIRQTSLRYSRVRFVKQVDMAGKILLQCEMD